MSENGKFDSAIDVIKAVTLNKLQKRHSKSQEVNI